MKTKWKLMAGVVGLCVMAQANFVTIGDPGNAGETHSYANGGVLTFGAVNYTYKISKYEVTIEEFMASGAGDGNENHWNDGTRTVGPSAPASNVRLYQAMKYCNWLTSGNINTGLYEDKGGGV